MGFMDQALADLPDAPDPVVGHYTGTIVSIKVEDEDGAAERLVVMIKPEGYDEDVDPGQGEAFLTGGENVRGTIWVNRPRLAKAAGDMFAKLLGDGSVSMRDVIADKAARGALVQFEITSRQDGDNTWYDAVSIAPVS